MISSEAKVGNIHLDLDSVDIGNLKYVVQARREVGQNIFSWLFGVKE